MFLTNVLAEVITWCAAIGGIVLVIFLIKDIIGLAKGDGSIAKVAVKVLCIFFIIGVMYAAGSFETFGKIFENLFEAVLTEENLPDLGQK